MHSFSSAERQRERETDRQTGLSVGFERHRERDIYRQTDMSCKRTSRPTDTQHRQTHRLTDTQHRQTDTQMKDLGCSHAKGHPVSASQMADTVIADLDLNSSPK